MSLADNLFIAMCRDILDNGYSSVGQDVRTKWADDGAPAHTKKRFGVVNRYDLSVEFPALTLRPTPMKNAIDELLWIWQKKSNRVCDLRSRIWDAWADAEGTIGKAYGYQLAQPYAFDHGYKDQVDNVLWQLKHRPASRRMLTNLYNFADLQDMGLEPCAYSVTFNVTGDRLNAILNQRSQDVLVANNWNVSQYAVLVHMMAQVSDLMAGELVHVIADAHIYDRHEDLVRELIARPTHPAPIFRMNPDIKDFYAFQLEDFEFERYETGPQVTGIPVAV